MSVDWNNTDAQCIAFDNTYGIEFPTVSGLQGGGNAIFNTYGVQFAPTYILIAPDHDIVIQSIWPYSTQTFVTAFEAQGVVQASCGGVTADFTSDITSACGEGTVSFSDMSEGDITSWLWTFEGGDPATSTEENPTVLYNSVGSWDVTLNVNGVDGDIFTIEDYIDIFEIPEVTQEPFDVACVFWVPFELTGGMPDGGEYSGYGVTDGMFDASVAGLGDHTITYTYISDDGCENFAEENLFVDACTGIDEINEAAVQIYPNPSVDVVNILSKSTMVSISIHNFKGQLMERMKLDKNSYQINTSSYPSGVYSIKIETKDSIISKRLIIK